MRTRVTDLLGIEVPIVQAPIGSASCPALAAAVSNAGGLGMLAGSWLDLDELRAAIRATFDLTTRPFGVNLVLEWPQAHRLQVALEEGVRIISCFWGDPAPYIPAVHAAGGFVLHTVGSVSEAKTAVASGADVIVAQGWEAGGHVRGEVALSVLVPAVCDAVGPTPVVAAGGIADGRGVAAALALGADGVWLGTRFLAAHEARVDPLYQARLLEASESDTVYTTLFDIGWPSAAHRVLRNSTVEHWLAAGQPTAPSRPGEGEVIAIGAKGQPVLRYSDTPPVAGATGDLEALALYAGQCAGLIWDVRPAAEIVQELVAGARAALARIAQRGIGTGAA